MDINSKIKDLMADPRAVAIMDEIVPGLTKDPRKAYAMNMTLKSAAAFVPTLLTKEVLEKVDAKLKELD